MLIKNQVKEVIDKFPESFTIDKLIDKVIFLDKVEIGNLQSEKGETITENELHKEIKKWFK